MKVFTTVCTMVALAAADSQLLIAQNNVDYYRTPNVGQTFYQGYLDYVPVLSQQPTHVYGTYNYPASMVMRFKREAEPEATHAKAYKSKVSDPNGGYYEYEVQVNRDGEGQSFQHHEQKQQRIEEQLYHNMMNARNSNALDRQIERFQDIMMDDRTRFGQRQQQQQYQMNRQNQIMNQLINMENQRNTFDRFFQQQRPLYSHRLINSKNNQQRQQYIREKLNNFGQRKSDERRMFKREADPSLMTYTVATSHPMLSFNDYRNNIYSNMGSNNLMSYMIPVAYRQATVNGESMKEFHPEGTMSVRNLYNADIYRLGKNFGYETLVDL